MGTGFLSWWTFLFCPLLEGSVLVLVSSRTEAMPQRGEGRSRFAGCSGISCPIKTHRCGLQQEPSHCWGGAEAAGSPKQHGGLRAWEKVGEVNHFTQTCSWRELAIICWVYGYWYLVLPKGSCKSLTLTFVFLNSIHKHAGPLSLGQNQRGCARNYQAPRLPLCL